MNFGLVVESERDGVAYPELIRKIRDDVENVLAIPCHGVSEVKKQFVGWLKYFQWSPPYRIDKALVITDSDRSAPRIREEVLTRVHVRSHFAPQFPVHFHATVREVETWLIADVDSINDVSRQRGKTGYARPFNEDPESLLQAKEAFYEALRAAKLPASPHVYGEIAAAADIQRIRNRCPSFRAFEEKVHSC